MATALSNAATTFLDLLQSSELLLPAQRDEVRNRLSGRFPQPQALARELLQRGWLTPYQVNQLLQGRGADLIVGPYILLERIGQGAAGQVFKARHQHMQRMVALKLIRQELLADTEVLGRFQREVLLISQLTHPNVVQAYDAGPAGANYFLALEYVEGIDLFQLVKKQGALPVEQASDYVRQTALGLQYIHERGLVHRDMKPSNLLRSPAHGSPSVGFIIKILDLGLARLQHPKEGEATANLTANGQVMIGTLDYMAPEQAIDFHHVDSRADIYSLGCTFYHLLTGQPPFPGRTLAQKLLCHQQLEPAPAETLRTDLPSGLVQMLRKMMAKQVENRWQTAAEVAAALGGSSSTALVTRSRASAPGTALRNKLPSPSEVIGTLAPLKKLTGRIPSLFRNESLPRRKRLWLAGGGAVALVLLLGMLIGAFAIFGRKTATAPVANVSNRSDPTAPVASVVKVLQGRQYVSDVLLDPDRPDVPLGNVAKDNAIRKHAKITPFLVHLELGKLGLTPQARVDRASVSFYVWDPSSQGKTKVCALVMKTAWDEGAATWRQPGPGRTWKSGPNFAIGTDTGLPGPFVVVEPDAPGTDTVDPPIEYSIDVTAIVRSWIDGSAPNHGLAIAPVADPAIDQGLLTRFQVYASEHPRSQYTPKLTIHVQP